MDLLYDALLRPIIRFSIETFSSQRNSGAVSMGNWKQKFNITRVDKGRIITVKDAIGPD